MSVIYSPLYCSVPGISGVQSIPQKSFIRLYSWVSHLLLELVWGVTSVSECPCVKHKLGCLVQISSLVLRQDFCPDESEGGKMDLWPGMSGTWNAFWMLVICLF